MTTSASIALAAGFAGFDRGVLLAISGLLLAFGVAILAPEGVSGLGAAAGLILGQ